LRSTFGDDDWTCCSGEQGPVRRPVRRGRDAGRGQLLLRLRRLIVDHGILRHRADAAVRHGGRRGRGRRQVSATALRPPRRRVAARPVAHRRRRVRRARARPVPPRLGAQPHHRRRSHRRHVARYVRRLLHTGAAPAPAASVNKEYLFQIRFYSISSELPVVSNTVVIRTVFVKVANSTFLVTNKGTKWAELSRYYLCMLFCNVIFNY